MTTTNPVTYRPLPGGNGYEVLDRATGQVLGTVHKTTRCGDPYWKVHTSDMTWSHLGTSRKGCVTWLLRHLGHPGATPEADYDRVTRLSHEAFVARYPESYLRAIGAL